MTLYHSGIFLRNPHDEPEVILSETSVLDDSNVYVHCHCREAEDGLLIRIWKSTFLIDTGSGLRSSLVHAENISIAPQWTIVPASRPYSFLLIFSGLPAGCKTFDFIEDIPQPGGFKVRNIRRNEKDVYHINLI
jgi:hypothetical protein